MNRNKIIRKMACVLTSAIVVTNTGICAINAYASDDTSKKEEVVYIITDASGNTKSVNVVNIFGKGSVTDYGNYSEVKMLNSTDEIKQDGDKITFTTDKDKVYYQGTLEDAQIPWNIKITYKLDGKEIKPDDLAGKSGKLNIHISITENSNANTDFYEQYALQAAFTLDTDKCKNIEADGATLANVGSDKQISYTVLPGKGLDADITAEVTDFTMDAASINGVKLNLDVEIDDSELLDKVKEIQDATKELNDGASDLHDGSSKLTDGGSTLADGASTLNDGVTSLNTGIGNLSSGVSDMKDALDKLNSNSKNLTDGSKKMLDSLKAIQSELSEVSASTDELKKLTESSAAIKSGITEAYNGAVALQQSIAYDSYKNTMKANGLDIDNLQSKNSQAVETLNSQISALSTQIQQLKSIPGYESNQTYASQVAQLEQLVSSLRNVVTLLQGNNAAISGTKQYMDTASAGAARLVSGLDTLKTNYETFDAAISQLTTQVSDMLVKVNKLKTAIDKMVTSYSSLDKGINNYTNGVASIVTAYSKIVSGTTSLAGGSKKLVTGADSLKKGSTDLYKGIVALDNGTKSLLDGTGEFYDKTLDADTQIEDKIDDMMDEISGGAEPIVSYVSDKNTQIESVQFVIKTDAVEKTEEEETTTTTTEKKSMWQKFIDLF